MKKEITLEQAVSYVKDGMTVMVGVKDLTVICNDTAFPDKSLGKLVVNKQIKKLIVSHVGTNPETGNQMNAGELEVEFSPQGTLAERIRAKGAGLGGVLTTTGMGTLVAEGKPVVNVTICWRNPLEPT